MSVLGKVAGTFVAAIGIARTIIALVGIANASSNWGSMPFVNPILWMDWVAMYYLFGFLPWSIAAAFVPIGCALMGAAIFVVSLWLCIGYAFFEYGKLQYEVLNVPSMCQGDFQTDPRRFPLLLLHELIFILAIISFIILVWRSWQQRFQPIGSFTKIVLAVGILLPVMAGLGLAAAEHNNPYLLLLSNGCYGSFVSGQLGYMNLDTAPLSVKVATVLGLNI